MKGLLKANVRTHAGRYVATSLAIALATTFILVCLGIASGFYASIARTIASNTDGASVVVTTQENVSNDEFEKVEASLKKTSFGSMVEASRSYSAEIVVKDGESLYSTIRPLRDAARDTIEYSEGRLPEKGDEVLLDGATLKALKLKVGDSVELKNTTWESGTEYRAKVTIVGVLPTVFIGGTTMVVPFETIDRLHLEGSLLGVLVRDTPISEVQAAVDAAQLTEQVRVQSRVDYISSTVDSMTSGTGVLISILIVFPALAIVTSIIVVSTTFNVLLAERKRELALLRAIGATKKQVRGLALKEALVVGAVSAFFGLVLGWIIAACINYFTGMLPSFVAALTSVSWWSFLISFVIGVLIAVVASFGPARRIAGVSPLVALHPEEATVVEQGGRMRRWLTGGIMFILGTSVMVFAVMFLENATRFLVALGGGIVSFLGAVLLIGVVMPKVVAVLSRVVARRSLETRLAGENAMRNPTRTGATGTALFLGVTLVVMIMTGASSVRYTVLGEIDERRPVDLVAYYDGTGLMNEKTVAKLNELDLVEGTLVTEGLNATVSVGDRKVQMQMIVESRDLTGYARSQVIQPSDNEIAVPYWLVQGDESKNITIAVGSETLTLKAKPGRVQWITVSPANFAKLKGAFGTAPQATEEELYGDGSLVLGSVTGTVGPKATYLKINPKVDQDSATQLHFDMKDVDDTMLVEGSLGERLLFTRVLNIMLTGVVGLLAISVVVALIGLANTLSLAVVERKRENSLLRALGMTQKSVRNMMSIEAAFIGVAALVLGVGMGVFYGWMGFQAMPLNVDDFVTSKLSVPWLQILGVIAVVMGAAYLASVIPGRKAAKAHPVEAMADAH